MTLRNVKLSILKRTGCVYSLGSADGYISDFSEQRFFTWGPWMEFRQLVDLDWKEGTPLFPPNFLMKCYISFITNIDF